MSLSRQLLSKQRFQCLLLYLASWKLSQSTFISCFWLAMRLSVNLGRVPSVHWHTGMIDKIFSSSGFFDLSTSLYSTLEILPYGLFSCLIISWERPWSKPALYYTLDQFHSFILGMFNSNSNKLRLCRLTDHVGYQAEISFAIKELRFSNKFQSVITAQIIVGCHGEIPFLLNKNDVTKFPLIGNNLRAY